MEVFPSFLLLRPPTARYEFLVSTGSFQFWHLLGGNTCLYGSLPGKSVWYEVLPFIGSKIARNYSKSRQWSASCTLVVSLFAARYYTINFQNCCHLVSWPPLRFLLLTLRMSACVELSPVTTDNASCFVASWLSINAKRCWFPVQRRCRCFRKLRQSS